MIRKLQTWLLAGIALGLVVAAIAPIASASSSPAVKITIPEWMTRIQYPGSSAQPTVYANPGVAIPAWLARIQYPGTFSEASVIIPRLPSKPVTGGVTVAAQAGRGFDWGAFSVGVGTAAGITLMAAGALMALRGRRPVPQA